MSKSLWQLQAEGKVITSVDSTDIFYVLRDPATGRLDRVITAANLLASLGGGVHDHNTLYYTEAEINALLAGLALVGHTHSAGNLDSLSDVTITAPSDTQVLKYNGSIWVNAADAGGAGGLLDDLTDVIITAAATGDLLRFNGTNWVDYPDSNFSGSAHTHGGVYQPLDGDLTVIAGLTPTTDNMIQSVAGAWASRTPTQVKTALALVIGTDIQAFDADLTTIAGLTPTTDNMIQSVAGVWASRTPAQVRTALALGTFAQLSSLNLDGLSDVIITAPSTGQVVKYNGTNWINDTDATGGGGGALDDLTDVTITAAATGDLLRYNGSAWVDSPDSAYQPADADLTTIAGLTPTTDNIIQSVAGVWASRTPTQVKTALALTPGTDIMAFDADLQTIAGLTPTTNNFLAASAGAWASRTPTQALAHLGLDADIATLVLPAATTISAFGATIVDDANGPAVLTTIGAAAASHTHTSLKEKDYTVSGTLIVSTGVARIYFKRAVTVTNIMAWVTTQPTGAAVIIDVNKNGTTIFTTQGNRPNIAVSTNTDLTSVPDVTSFAAGDYATVDIDQIGSTIAGANLGVSIEYTESIT